MDEKYLFVAKLLGSIIREFCRMYGVDTVESFIRSIGTRPQFWMNARSIVERKIPTIDMDDIMGEDDPITVNIADNPPPQGEKEE